MEIDNELLIMAAYAMQQAYRDTDSLGDAVHSISDKFPTLKDGILRGMWMAIDAYVDLN
jgi:hypothetical protein